MTSTLLRFGGLILAVTIISVGWCEAARADPAKATEYFERGIRLYQVGDYGQAIEQFKAGHIEEPDSSFVFNIAQCHRQLGNTKEALSGYRRFLAMDPETSLRADVERKIAVLDEQAKREISVLTPAVESPVVVPRPLPARVTATDDLATRASSPTSPSPDKPLAALPRWPLWLGGSMTLAFAGSATVLGLTTSNRFESLRASCGRQSESGNGCPKADVDSIRTRTGVVNGLWALAGLSAVSTGAWVYVGRNRTELALAFSF